VTACKPALIAVDGLVGGAIVAAARTALASIDREARGGISHWDASGVFGEAAVAGDEAGRPSARTLLLLYAADLAFRLRWEIRPALAEGRGVVAAPYVDTAVAFGRAAGIERAWLANLFQFAPRPTERRCADDGTAGSRRGRGFVEFALEHSREAVGATRTGLVARMAVHLRAKARRRGSLG
jgi:hypothetical protein